jgi:hypothetical protein
MIIETADDIRERASGLGDQVSFSTLDAFRVDVRVFRGGPEYAPVGIAMMRFDLQFGRWMLHGR